MFNNKKKLFKLMACATNSQRAYLKRPNLINGMCFETHLTELGKEFEKQVKIGFSHSR